MGELSKWPLADLIRERDSYRKHLGMALREMNAGNRRMLAFAEGYAKRLDHLSFEIARRQQQNTPGTNPTPCDVCDVTNRRMF